MDIKIIVSFISGLVIGGGIGVLSTKKYFQNKYTNRKLGDIESKYCEDDAIDTDEVINSVYGLKGAINSIYGLNSSDDESEMPPAGGRMSPEERASIKEKLDANWRGTTNYAGMYHLKNGYTENKLAEIQHPLDQGEYGEEETDENYVENSIDEEAFDDHQKNFDKPPKIISAETYSNLPQYIDQHSLLYYPYDDILCEEDETPVEDPSLLVGDALTKYNFKNNDEQTIFVMNHELDTCFEINKMDGQSWK